MTQAHAIPLDPGLLVRQVLQVLAADGVDAVRVEALAKRLGVTKGDRVAIASWRVPGRCSSRRRTRPWMRSLEIRW